MCIGDEVEISSTTYYIRLEEKEEKNMIGVCVFFSTMETVISFKR